MQHSLENVKGATMAGQRHADSGHPVHNPDIVGFTQAEIDETPVKVKWNSLGPGIVAAATGVGAADLVATLTAGSRYGYMLMWAVVLGVVFKIVLVEGTGRYYLSTGKTIFQGWRTLGVWTSWYFGIYIMIWGFVYGATAMSSVALPLAALFPGVDSKIFAVVSGLIGLGLVWINKYGLIEKLMTVLIGIMFFAVLVSAALTAPNLGEILTGLIPRIPAEEGAMFYVLGLAGGVGGTITLAAYGYWLREKGWNTPKWMKVMRYDNATAYILTGIFVIATMIMGVELLHSASLLHDDLISTFSALRHRPDPAVLSRAHRPPRAPAVGQRQPARRPAHRRVLRRAALVPRPRRHPQRPRAPCSHPPRRHHRHPRGHHQPTGLDGPLRRHRRRDTAQGPEVHARDRPPAARAGVRCPAKRGDTDTGTRISRSGAGPLDRAHDDHPSGRRTRCRELTPVTRPRGPPGSP